MHVKKMVRMKWKEKKDEKVECDVESKKLVDEDILEELVLH